MTPVADFRGACPSLTHHPGDLDAVLPHTTTRTVDGALDASYTCPACGWEWETGWDAEAARWPCERAERAS